MEKTTGYPFCIGIDLGTSNSALAMSLAADTEPEVMSVPQLTSPGTVGQSKVLPSAIYVPHEGELSPKDGRLPWSAKGEPRAGEPVVGAWARERGSQVPERLVSSAKS